MSDDQSKISDSLFNTCPISYQIFSFLSHSHPSYPTDCLCRPLLLPSRFMTRNISPYSVHHLPFIVDQVAVALGGRGDTRYGRRAALLWLPFLASWFILNCNPSYISPLLHLAPLSLAVLPQLCKLTARRWWRDCHWGQLWKDTN